MAKIDKVEIKERVNQVAMDMILKFGLRGLNMVELADGCGLAKATLYKIIGTKEDLVREISIEIFNVNIIKTLYPFKPENDPIEASREFLNNYFNYAIQGQKILLLQIFKEYPLIEKSVNEYFDVEMQKVISCYKIWQERKLVREDVNVEYCIEVLHVLNDHYIISDYSDEEIIKRLQSAFRCTFIGMGIPL
ncbi:TetR/AcrR family transcriptional regulator [Ancylomarina longa]|uniref:TetR/AcrR family transcriptional regulator n=1 Tax=Ancylomarina longa TaxID=2487017 RepID=A0A434AX13_9BACT|nr:TetR/AcrR family transcriptional regulator [Ancylomarina longa]RUT78976.1 TetR/AcrR family transcriptional regulator [Ancylomarina longa]